WIMMLTMIAWFLTLFLGLLTQFDGLDISLLVESFKEFSIGGVLLFILSTPIILVTLVMKNYVPTIIFTVVITLINVMGGSRSEEHTSELQSRFDLVCRLLLRRPLRSPLFPYTTLFRSLLTQFDGLDISLLVESFKEFSIGGVLLFILSTPIILVTLVMKNYVPTIIFTVVITLINVMGGSSEHRALFPWAAAGDIAN